MPRTVTDAFKSEASRNRVVVEAYRRILRAAKRGTGCNLSQFECECMQWDDAISTRVHEHDANRN